MRLLAELHLLGDKPADVLPSIDVAANYYAIRNRDPGLEAFIIRLLQGSTVNAASVHDRLAALLPKLMNYPRLRGRVVARQLLVSATLDMLMERALLRSRINFCRSWQAAPIATLS